jgi:hypothetical protein
VLDREREALVSYQAAGAHGCRGRSRRPPFGKEVDGGRFDAGGVAHPYDVGEHLEENVLCTYCASPSISRPLSDIIVQHECRARVN